MWGGAPDLLSHSQSCFTSLINYANVDWDILNGDQLLKDINRSVDT